jgi:ribonuclease P protein component
MRREQRLRRRSDFAAVYQEGRAQSHRLLVVRVLPNGQTVTRFGFVAGKIVGGAVVRNAVKRRLREAARQLPVVGGYDVVVGARKSAAEVGFADLRRGLESTLTRAGVLSPDVARERP